jgi:hypothetical protein
MDKKLDEVLAQLAIIQRDNAELKRMFGALEKRIDDRLNQCDERVKQCEDEVVSLKVQSEKQRSEMELLRTTIRLLENKAAQADQYSRRKNIIVSGVPQYDNEVPADIVKRVASALRVNVEVEIAHRLSHTQRDSPIIAVLKSQQQKTDMVIARSKRKREFKVRHIFSACSDDVAEESVYVNEQLGETQRHLFIRVRVNREQLGFKSCFTSNGRVYLTNENDRRKVLVDSQEKLVEMLRDAGKEDLFRTRRT